MSDDAAFLKPPTGCDLVLKTDAIVGGVHFFPDDAAPAVASKALRVNLSDLAAKGARPLGFLLSLALPRDIGEQWLEGFAQGLRGDAILFGCPLFGGDTTTRRARSRFPSRCWQCSGRDNGAPRRRERPATGCLSAALLAMPHWVSWCVEREMETKRAQRKHLVSRYLLPQPRNALAEAVRTHASAAMDISDGLVGDFAKLCRASGVAADIDIARIPLSDAAKTVIAADSSMLETVLTGGDDYEIVCTVPAAKADSFHAAAKAAGSRSLRSARSRRARATLSSADGHALISSAPRSLIFEMVGRTHQAQL